MKRWLSVTIFSFILCFLIGAWWGHYLEEQKDSTPVAKTEITFLAEKGLISNEIRERIFKNHQIKLNVVTYNSPRDILEQLKLKPEIDIVQFPAVALKSLVQSETLAPLDSQRLKNLDSISKDLRHGIWDTDESFSLPFFWNALVFAHQKETQIKVDSIRSLIDQRKHYSLSLARSLENLLWITQNLKEKPRFEDFDGKTSWLNFITQLPWAKEGDDAKFKSGQIELYQLSWTQLQDLDSEKNLKLWFPKERSPFFMDSIAITKSSFNNDRLDAAYDALGVLFTAEIYRLIVSQAQSAGVLSASLGKVPSAEIFRKLPLSKMRPLTSDSFDLDNYSEASLKLLNGL